MTRRRSLVECFAVRVVRRRWPLSTVLQEAGIGNSIEPAGKPGLAAKLIQLAPCQQECFLSKIIGPCVVAMQEAAQLRAYHALMTPHQLFERAPVIRQNDTGHQRMIDLSCGKPISHACHRAD